jgi:hypothetical protein
LAHDAGTHAAPLDDADPEELELLAETQLPALHVAPVAVQSLQGPPPVPQVVSPAVWHVLVESQQPVAHEVLSHVAPLLLPPVLLLPLVPLLLEGLPELLALLV